MVCLPCIFLPVLMFIYLKFIQPYVYRILPDRIVHLLDPILYPTCPVQVPESSVNKETESEKPCCSAGGEETKKEK
ncbi:unnamed protein product [Caenorhabditis bovis]|uniref:CR032 protein n=1 Tax=Caenorhabditis bovis TaxID=2654633 RepID=A0A8S1F2Z3_9PELO|nr:unnamed protein product [Caenorhabditis bovis]